MAMLRTLLAERFQFFTAFREQLGLRFQSTTGPLDAYVIERVEPPTPD
jgi:uncharacterized protein (TIGR03435 family)